MQRIHVKSRIIVASCLIPISLGVALVVWCTPQAGTSDPLPISSIATIRSPSINAQARALASSHAQLRNRTLALLKAYNMDQADPQRASTIAQVLSSMTAQEASHFAQTLNGLPEPSQQDESGITAFMIRWAELDPHAALLFALQSADREHYRSEFYCAAGEAFSVWAHMDLTSAREFYETRIERPMDVARMSHYLVSAMLATDEKATFEWIKHGIPAHRSDLRAESIQCLTRQWLAAKNDSDIEHLTPWLTDAALVTTDGGPQALLMLSTRLEGNRLVSLADALPDLPGSPREALLHEGFKAWALRDPHAAVSWLNTEIDHSEAATSNLTESEQNLITGAVITAMGLDHPETATNALEAITDPKLRESIRSTLQRIHPR